MRLPNAFVVPRVKRWTHPSAARAIVTNRLVHALERLADRQDQTNEITAERLALLEADQKAKRERDRAARRRVP